MESPNEDTVTDEVNKGRLERIDLGVLAVTRPLLSQLDRRDIARQLRRSASAAFSNYGAACVARSHADFTSKIGIALEEADESLRWLRLLRAGDLLEDPRANGLISEAGELRAILSSAHLTAKRNREKYKRQGR
jgi:four helix bundle protein